MRDRDRAATDTYAASQALRTESAGARQLQKRCQAGRLGTGDRRAKWRNPVVAATLVVELGHRPLAQLDDETLLEHPLNRAIQRSCAERDLAVRSTRDLLHDGVAVQVVARQREQDMEGRRRQGQQRLDVWIMHAQ